jgi:hypothetical protein
MAATMRAHAESPASQSLLSILQSLLLSFNQALNLETAKVVVK